MNNAISFFVGCVTFTLVMFLKIPVKKLTWHLAKQRSADSKSQYIFYKKYNLVIFLLAAIVAVAIYAILYHVMELDHFKWCCTMKAAAMAVAIYAVYEQWFGGNGPGD